MGVVEGSWKSDFRVKGKEKEERREVEGRRLEKWSRRLSEADSTHPIKAVLSMKEILCQLWVWVRKPVPVLL